MLDSAKIKHSQGKKWDKQITFTGLSNSLKLCTFLNYTIEVVLANIVILELLKPCSIVQFVNHLAIGFHYFV